MLRWWLGRVAVLVVVGCGIGLLAGAPTLAGWAEPGAGTVVTAAYLQGRSNHQGTEIIVDGIPVGTTDPDGEIILSMLPGTHTIVVRHGGYLSAQAVVEVVNLETVNLEPVLMLGGDTNGDDRVSLFDLVAVGSGYGSSPPSPAIADINGNGRVDLPDLVMLGANYGLVGPLPWGPQPPPTATPTVNLTPSLTPTPIITKTPLPFTPQGACVFIFRDGNADGRWDLGEQALGGWTFRIYDTVSPIQPENALAEYTFGGSETMPKCFPNAGLTQGTYRIQVTTAPGGQWGLIFSDPFGPVRPLENVVNVWEVDVESGKAVFWSYAGGTPQPTSTVTPLNQCGVITTYNPPAGPNYGTVQFQGAPMYYVAPGAAIQNSQGMGAGKSGCLAASMNSAGYIASGVWTAHTPTPTATPTRTPTRTPTATRTATPVG